VLNDLVPPDEIIKIDALEIALPVLNMQSWQQTLTPSVKKALRDELERLLLYPKATETVRMERRSISYNHFEAWLYFLKAGQLPPVYAATSDAVWQEAVLEIIATQSAAAAQLRGYLLQPHTGQRLIYQFDEAFLMRLIAAMTGKTYAFLIPIREAIRTFLNHTLLINRVKTIKTQLKQSTAIGSLSHRDFDILFWSSVFKKISESDSAAVESSRQEILTQHILSKIFEQTFGLPFRQYIIKTLESYTGDSAGKETVLTQVEQEITAIVSDKSLAAILISLFKKAIETNTLSPQKQAPLLSPNKPDILSKKDTEDTATTLPSDMPTENPAAKTPIDETFDHPAEADNTDDAEQTDTVDEPSPEPAFIHNAGIVLLHPFLAPLFDALALLKSDKSFKNKKSAAKAVVLLHYLATGKTEPPEYALALPKLLCGIPSRTPIDKYQDLTVAEKQEADTLLQAVIKHWGALGTVGNDSLRQGFLQRDGKLSHRDNDRVLQVEAQTLDILLDSLPWGLGVIRLPWMKTLLFVEWH
jgi:hypothetical protein